MTKKKLLAALLAAAMMVGMTACSSSSSDSSSSTTTESTTTTTTEAATTEAHDYAADEDKTGETVFKLSFNQTLENPEAMAMLDMSDDLYVATEGRYSIEVYPSEQLGAQQQSMELVQSGAIEMAIVANSIIETVNSEFAIIGTPYVYDNIEHQEVVFNSGILDDLFASTAANGFQVLSAYSLGARNLYGTSPMTTTEELAGQKIRVMQSDTMVQMLNEMGGVGVAMGQGDVYSAIQNGTLDGGENNIITYVDLLQYEVAPCYSESNHLLIPDELIINSAVLASMSEADQAALMQCAKDSMPVMFDYAEDLRATYYAMADELGFTIYEVDITPFQENLSDFIAEVAGRSEQSQAIYDAIRELA